MDDLFAEFQRLVGELQGQGLTGALNLLLRQLGPDVAHQLRLCAIPHHFDAPLLSVMTPELDYARAHDLCVELSQLSVVLARGEGFALHDEARAHLFEWWLGGEERDTFSRVSALLAEHFDRRTRDTSEGAREQAEWQRMFHRLGADQAAGFAEFERLFRSMRHRFRPDACEALLHLVHEYDDVLAPEHAARLRYHEGKLAADRRAWGRAEQLFGAVLGDGAIDPVTRIKARNRLGCVMAETREWPRAIELQMAALGDVRGMPERGELEYRVLHDLGAAYRDAGELDQAYGVLTESVTLAESAADLPAQATSYNSLGTLWRKMGDTQQAIVAYQKSLDALSRTDDPYRPAQVYNNLGVACSELRDWEHAEAWFTSSLEIKRKAGDTIGQAMTLGNLARVYQQRGDVDRAIEMLERSIGLFAEMQDKQNVVMVRRHVGRLHAIAGRTEAARAALTQAADGFKALGDTAEAAATRQERDDLGRRPGLPRWLKGTFIALALVGILSVVTYFWANYQLNHGTTLLNEGRPREAAQYLTRALSVFPDNAVALNNRGLAYHNVQRHDEAIADLTRSIDVEPNDAVPYFNRGEAHLALNHLDEAWNDYEKALSLDQSIALAYRGRGNVRARRGQAEEAIADYTKGLSLEPKDALGYALRAMAYQETGRPDQAVADFTRSIEINPKDADAYNLRSLVHFRLHRDAESLEDLNTAIGLVPQSAIFHSNRGLARLSMDQYDAARTDLTTAIQLEPTSPFAYNHRGRVATQLNDLDAALADLSKAIEIDPNYAMAYGNRGFVYHLKGDRDRARFDYLKQVELERPRVPTSRPLVLLAIDGAQSGDAQSVATYCGDAQRLIRAGERNPYYRDEALSAAMCDLMTGNTARAIAAYRSAAPEATVAARHEAGLRLKLLPSGVRGVSQALAALDAANR